MMSGTATRRARPHLWVLEIGEPLPLTGEERLLRYGLVLPELAETFEITWWTSTFIHQKMAAFSASDETITHRGVRIEALAGPGYPKSTSLRRLWHHWHFARTFSARATGRERPDVILVSNPTSDNLRVAKAAALRFDARLVVDIRDNWPDDLANAVFGGQGRWLARLLLAPYFAWSRACISAADVVVASSPLQLDYAQGLIGDQPLPPGSRTIFHPFPAVTAGGSEQVYRANLQELGVDFDRPLVVFAGTVGRFFELDLVVAAMEELRERNVQLVVAGDGVRREALQSTISDLGLDADCVLTGWLERAELATLLNHAVVGLAPYVQIAGVGNKIGEYFAHGVPVVSSIRSDVVDESVAQGCAAYYEPGSRQALVAAIAACLELGEDAEGVSVSARCQAIYERHFSVRAARDCFQAVLWPS